MVSPFDLRKFVGGVRQPGDLSRILKVVGEMAVSDSQSNFDKQSFGKEKWERRYPNQTPFRINVAGAVADLATGPSIKSRRFQPKPAGLDTGQLRASISARKIGRDAVEVGSTLPYAVRVNSGGISSQPITSTVKKNLKLWLKKNKRFRPFIGYIFQLDALRTNVVPRKFIGKTPQFEKDIARLVKLVIEGRI